MARRRFYKDEENPYDVVENSTSGVLRNEEKIQELPVQQTGDYIKNFDDAARQLSGVGSFVSATGTPRIQNTDGATFNIDWSKGNVQSVVLQGSRTITFSNQSDGQILSFLIIQDGTGSRTVTWPSTVSWPGAAAPILTTTANKADLIVLIHDKINGTEYGYITAKNFTSSASPS